MTERLLMAVRGTDRTGEAEPVVVNTDDPKTVVLTLDDGQTLALDRAELRNTLDEPTQEAA